MQLRVQPDPAEVRSEAARLKAKVEADADSNGRCVLGPAARLLVGRKYIVEVLRSEFIAATVVGFEVVPLQEHGTQVVDVLINRAIGDVDGLFRMIKAETSHWS